MIRPPYSILIPTFRRGESLAEFLESVCALDCPLDALEVIIVDNGGPDHTRAAAEPFTQRLEIRYLVNPVNRGYGFSVNRGIVESTGERLMLLNDDARAVEGVPASIRTWWTRSRARHASSRASPSWAGKISRTTEAVGMSNQQAQAASGNL